jgi:hypothetical protein
VQELPMRKQQLIFEYPTETWYEYSGDIFYIITDISKYLEVLVSQGILWETSYSRDVFADLDPFPDE